MTVEQSPLERFTNQSQPPLLSDDKDSSQSPTSGVIDLTNDGADKDNDLSKAIALSLKEQEKVFGGQVSMEDQDISRVVEASLAESKAVGTKRKRGEVWQDPFNPHDRKRNNDWPVGLKNVGNTCWFSAVIQSLFHLPIFRRLVICYHPPSDWNSIANDTKEKRNLIFMRELRKLFALMLCSKRKYVDPSHALEELKEAFPDSGSDTQQDVSEFSHKLLEYLEEAYKLKSCYTHHIKKQGAAMEEGTEEFPHNPMLDLFYGHFRSEGHNKGRMFSNEETFGQYPLQVNNFNDIHESLEAAMTQEIESYDVMSKSGQESWFTRLPPVLLFELSRFQFNQQLGRPEKIHNKLEFPEVMYMDRYIEQNKNVTRSKREKVRRLKDERDKLNRRLERYLNYGSGSKKVPLSTVLDYTLEFMESKKSFDNSSPMSFFTEDVDMASPASVSSMGGDSPNNSPNKPNALDLGSSTYFLPSSYFLPNSICSSTDQVASTTEESTPTPQHVSELELKVIQTCLKRWRTEVESNVRTLQDNISNIESTIKDIYTDSSLQQNPYRLHAVLIHEGQAASGHYWAYVYSPTQLVWLKFNDISVTQASWSDVQKDSMGGQNLASAYCLMYVDKRRNELFEEVSIEKYDEDLFAWLPEDLQEYVASDNSNFELEMEQWDCEQSRKKDTSTMTNNDADCAIIAEKRMSSESYENQIEDLVLALDETDEATAICNAAAAKACKFQSVLSMEHAVLQKRASISRIEQVSKMINNQGHFEAFEEITRQETSRLRRLIRLPTVHYDDIRLQHVGVYILLNSNNPEPFLTWSIYEQFLLPELDQFHSGHLIKEAAIQKLDTLQISLNKDHFARYRLWHQQYQIFRKAVGLFIVGVENYHNKCYSIALNCMMYCHQLNASLKTSWIECKKNLNPKLISHYRRRSALKLNEELASDFESTDLKKSSDALAQAQEHLLPTMEFLASSTASIEDNEAAEIIRHRWCSMLAYDMPNPKQEKLQDYLTRLLDPTLEMRKERALPLVHLLCLEEKYQAAMNVCVSSGEYREAMVPHDIANKERENQRPTSLL